LIRLRLSSLRFSDAVVTNRFELPLPLMVIGPTPVAFVTVNDLLTVSGESSVIWPVVLKLIVSLLAAPAIAARNDPAPLSLLLMTDQTAINRRGSRGSMRARDSGDNNGDDDDDDDETENCFIGHPGSGRDGRRYGGRLKR